MAERCLGWNAPTKILGADQGLQHVDNDYGKCKGGGGSMPFEIRSDKDVHLLGQALDQAL